MARPIFLFLFAFVFSGVVFAEQHRIENSDSLRIVRENEQYFNSKEREVAPLYAEGQTIAKIGEVVGSRGSADFYVRNLESMLGILDLVKEQQRRNENFISGMFKDGKITKEDAMALRLYMSWKDGKQLSFEEVGRQLRLAKGETDLPSQSALAAYAQKRLNSICDKVGCDLKSFRWQYEDFASKMINAFPERFTPTEAFAFREGQWLLSEGKKIKDITVASVLIYNNVLAKAGKVFSSLSEEEKLKALNSPPLPLDTENPATIYSRSEAVLKKEADKILAESRVKELAMARSDFSQKFNEIEGVLRQEDLRLLKLYINGSEINDPIIRALAKLMAYEIKLEKDKKKLEVVKQNPEYFSERLKEVAGYIYTRGEGGKIFSYNYIANEIGTSWSNISNHVRTLEGRLAVLSFILEKEEKAKQVINNNLQAGIITSEEARALELYSSWENGKRVEIVKIGRELFGEAFLDKAVTMRAIRILRRASAKIGYDLDFFRWSSNDILFKMYKENPGYFTAKELEMTKKYFDGESLTSAERQPFYEARKKAEALPLLITEEAESADLLSRYLNNLPENERTIAKTALASWGRGEGLKMPNSNPSVQIIIKDLKFRVREGELPFRVREVVAAGHSFELPKGGIRAEGLIFNPPTPRIDPLTVIEPDEPEYVGYVEDDLPQSALKESAESSQTSFVQSIIDQKIAAIKNIMKKEGIDPGQYLIKSDGSVFLVDQAGNTISSESIPKEKAKYIKALQETLATSAQLTGGGAFVALPTPQFPPTVTILSPIDKLRKAVLLLERRVPESHSLSYQINQEGKPSLYFVDKRTGQPVDPQNVFSQERLVGVDFLKRYIERNLPTQAVVGESSSIDLPKIPGVEEGFNPREASGEMKKGMLGPLETEVETEGFFKLKFPFLP